MAETFDIVFIPTRASFQRLAAALHASLVKHQWIPSLAERIDEGDHGMFPPARALEALSGRGRPEVAYRHGGRRLSLIGQEVGRYRSLWLGSDYTFFSGIRAVEEFRTLLPPQLPERTYVFGGDQGDLLRLDAAVGRGRLSSLLSRDRLRRQGFYWVDTLTPLFRNRLFRFAPLMADRTLTRSGRWVVVLMWDSPYEGKFPVVGEDPRRRLRRLARTVAEGSAEGVQRTKE